MDELRNDQMQDEELERYGVWVKAGPEEVIEADDDYSLSDLSEESEDTGDEPMTAPADEFQDTGDTEDLPSLDEFDDISLDDLDFGDDQETESADQSESSPVGEAPSLGDSSDELTIGDTPQEAQDEEDLISLDDFDLEVPDDEPDPFRSLPNDEEQKDDSSYDFDLDALEEDLPDDFEELDLDEPDQLQSDEFDSSIPGSDGELDDLSVDDISVDDTSEELPELEADAIEQTEHDFTPEDQGIEIESLASDNTISPDEEEFLSDQSDLQNESESAIPPSMDLQEREAFERIQTELSDIKKELAELKAALRGAGTPAVADVPPTEEPASDDFAPTEEPASDDFGFEAPTNEIEPDEISERDEASEDEPADDSTQPGPGFFEDEEDETIALTGDELDNILNTAEFTEQAGQAVELEDDFIVEPTPSEEPEGNETNLDEDVDLDAGDAGDAGDAESTGEIPTNDNDVDSIELEPVNRDPVVFEGDDSAVDELAEMDIDSELADIDSLEDDSDDDTDDLEIDLDSLDDVDTSGVLDDSAESAAEESAAELDQQALQAEAEDLGDLEIDDLDLDEGAEESEESEAPVQEAIAAGDEDESENDDFDQFAAAVEEDISSGGTGVQLDEEFDDEPASEPEPESSGLDSGEDEEIEIDLDDIDGIDDFDEDHGEEPVSEEPEFEEPDLEEPEEEPAYPAAQSAASISDLPDDLKQEIRSVLSYMDQLLEALPDDKIEEFAHSEHFEVYKRLFEELGLET
ncbi:MAG: hypothetical protein WD492_17390 [Alkalispirochaeta sp.]